MSIEVLEFPKLSNNPLQRALTKLIRDLAAVKAPTIPSWPEPEDWIEVKDHINAIGRIANQWLAAVGREVESNATTTINLKLFETAYTDATEGLCEWECQRLADEQSS